MPDQNHVIRPDPEEFLWWMPLIAHAIRHNLKALIFSESAKPWEVRRGNSELSEYWSGAEIGAGILEGVDGVEGVEGRKIPPVPLIQQNVGNNS